MVSASCVLTEVGPVAGTVRKLLQGQVDNDAFCSFRIYLNLPQVYTVLSNDSFVRDVSSDQPLDTEI